MLIAVGAMAFALSQLIAYCEHVERASINDWAAYLNLGEKWDAEYSFGMCVDRAIAPEWLNAFLPKRYRGCAAANEISICPRSRPPIGSRTRFDFSSLKVFRYLRGISLTCYELDDEDLPSLSQLSALEELELMVGSSMPDATQDKLQQLMPNLKIVNDNHGWTQ